MKDLFDKLSSYNFFNYLLPGILFAIFLKFFVQYDLIQENNFLGAFLYYFIGMVISRFGSVVIEPILKVIGFIKFEQYKKFVTASQKDAKIELLSEVNNTYRTIISLVTLTLMLKLYAALESKYNFGDNIGYSILLFLLLVLFLFSYRKQTGFITKRVNINN
jgi:hypothetical protein